MQMDMKKEIAALGRMTVKELRERHIDLFGEPTRSGNRQWIFRRLAWRVQALAEGDLSDRARQRATQLARETDVRLRPPPGMNMAAPTEALAITRHINIPRDARLPMPGAVLTRVFKGHEYRVTVLPNGFEYDGDLYRSLSSIAHVITGSHWNGFHFFGIQKPE